MSCKDWRNKFCEKNDPVYKVHPRFLSDRSCLSIAKTNLAETSPHTEMMKPIVVLTLVQGLLVQITIGYQGNLAYPDGADGKPGSRNRDGRILASYAKNTMENLAQVVVKLDNVTSAVSKVVSEIEGLTDLQNSSNSQTVAALENIHDSLVSGSRVVSALKRLETNAANILSALSNPADKQTLVSQLANLNSILDSKLSNIEKLAGYDEYTTTPSTTGICPCGMTSGSVWHVPVYSTGGQFEGSATLISPEWALTSGIVALYAEESKSVVYLTQKLSDRNSNATIRIEIDQAIQHEMFETDYDYNIGLLHLAQPITCSNLIQPACFPSSYSTTKWSGKYATTAGWDSLWAYKPLIDSLEGKTLSLLDSDDCTKKVGYSVANTTICSFSTEKTKCKVDRGSPLTYRDPSSGRVTVIGVMNVPHDAYCGEPGNAGSFIKVSQFIDWIQEKTGTTFPSS